MPAEKHGPQNEWKKEQEKINERAARGPVKTWTPKQRTSYAMELMETSLTNHGNQLLGTLKQLLQVGDTHLDEIPSPFDGFEDLGEALEDVENQIADLVQDIRTLGQFARDYRNQEGPFKPCPSPAVANTTDPLSFFLGTGKATQF